MILTLSSIALPGTNGFIGEFLILLGSWQSNPGLAALSALGVIFGAVYMLLMFQKVMFGPVKNKENEGLKDLSLREGFVLIPLLVAVFVMGICPNFFFNKMDSSIQKFMSRSNPTAYASETLPKLRPFRLMPQASLVKGK